MGTGIIFIFFAESNHKGTGWLSPTLFEKDMCKMFFFFFVFFFKYGALFFQKSSLIKN